MNTDLSFITNEENQNLKERFKVLINSTDFFDCLVVYFYSSGFYAIYPSLEITGKIRILIGINTSRSTFEMLEKANEPTRNTFDFSHAEAKHEVENLVQQEMEDSEDNRNVEEGVHKFIEWIRIGKLEIRAYPSQQIHSKLYIMTIQGKTWLTQNITPYQLYLKFLYEYFKDQLSQTDEVFVKYLPLEFKKLEYQEQAVLTANKILLEYGGCLF